MIVANSTAVFGNDSSSVTVLSKENSIRYSNKSKSEIATYILDFAKEMR